MCNNQIKNSGKVLANTVREMYSEGQTDYSFEPVIAVDNQGKAVGRIEENDAVVFCCRRGEREIQLTEAFTEPNFNKFQKITFTNLPFVILTLYHDKFIDLPVAFAPVQMKDTLGEVVSKAGLSQVRISESEKFAHVTFFLNGGNNKPFSNEKDIRVPSPKGIPFDKVPELKLDEVAEKVIESIINKEDLIVTNFANGDVIGHTANREAKIKCAEVIDRNLAKVVAAARDAGYVTLITADHGNLEELFNEDGTPNGAHTTNLVDFILIDPIAPSRVQLKNGKLADVAPTILNALDLPQPSAMTGSCLTVDHHFGSNRKVLLIILDGWGIGKQDESNPIFLANTPAWDQLIASEATSTLEASGEAVGLKAGKAGNSEAGHMNLGGGRVVLQDDVRLDSAMKDGSFYENTILLQAIDHAINNKSKLHLIGLLTLKSSHGSIDYPLAMLKMAKERGLTDVFLHMIFDGRSTEPGSAPTLLEMLDEKINAIGVGQIVSGIGRGIALDRDGNYSKTEKAYNAFVFGKGRPSFIK
ncbi:MAG: phosphoglycerate mutase (2,3-diphosphoglycerate-independent) [Anaerolinea sp.]|nr:phosphoglycerate mutase (2,3-diphosphoglycerate-independent) [Anaerolinea sp.]